METKSYWKSRRCTIVIMTFFGFVNYFSVNGNIGMAIVEMTSSKKIILPNGTEYLKPPEFDWNSKQRVFALSSFAYGRLLSPIGGTLANKLGGSTLYGFSVACTALILTVCPFVLQFNFYLFLLLKMITGSCESFAFTSISELLSRWIPPDERARCVSIGLLGLNGGYFVTFILAGWILATWSWNVLFYVSGAIAFGWCLLWITIVKNDPSDDKHISQEELKYIQMKLNNTKYKEKVLYPWKDILTSIPLWVVCLFKFCEGSAHTFLIMYLPQYIKDISNIDIEQIGYISAIPQVCAIASMLLAGNSFDYIRKRNILSVTNAHKLNVSIGLFSGAVALIIANIWPTFVICVVCLSVLTFFLPFSTVTIIVSYLDLARRYASFINGVVTLFYTAGCILTPIFVEFCVTNHSQHQWNICFITLAVVFTTTAVLYLIYGSGEQQPWANYGIEDSTRDEDGEKRVDLLATDHMEQGLPRIPNKL